MNNSLSERRHELRKVFSASEAAARCGEECIPWEIRLESKPYTWMNRIYCISHFFFWWVYLLLALALITSDWRKMSRNDLDFGAMQHVSCITSQIILCPSEKILVLCLFWNVENKSWTEFEACYFLLPNKSASLGLLLLFFSFCLPHGKLRWNSVCAGKKRHGSLLASCIAVEEKQKETVKIVAELTNLFSLQNIYQLQSIVKILQELQFPIQSLPDKLVKEIWKTV